MECVRFSLFMGLGGIVGCVLCCLAVLLWTLLLDGIRERVRLYELSQAECRINNPVNAVVHQALAKRIRLPCIIYPVEIPLGFQHHYHLRIHDIFTGKDIVMIRPEEGSPTVELLDLRDYYQDRRNEPLYINLADPGSLQRVYETIASLGIEIDTTQP